MTASSNKTLKDSFDRFDRVQKVYEERVPRLVKHGRLALDNIALALDDLWHLYRAWEAGETKYHNEHVAHVKAIGKKTPDAMLDEWLKVVDPWCPRRVAMASLQKHIPREQFVRFGASSYLGNLEKAAKVCRAGKTPERAVDTMTPQELAEHWHTKYRDEKVLRMERERQLMDARKQLHGIGKTLKLAKVG